MSVIDRSFTLGCAVLLASAVGLAGCTKNDNASSDATASPGVSASASAAASPAASAPASASGVSLSDISGVNGEKEITELAQLGVVDPVTGTFAPGGSLKRRDFIRWLVKSNNVIWSDAPGKRVKLADKTE